MERVRQELEEYRDVDVENVLPILPVELQSYIKSCLPITRLKKVPMLRSVDEEVLRAICEHMKPIKYTNIRGRVYHSRDGEPLEKMIFIVEGDLGVERRNSATRDLLYEGDFYGEELVHWVSVSHTSFPARLPLSVDSAYVTNNDSILILMADDLKSVVSKFRLHFSKEITLRPDEPELLRSVQLTMLKKVPRFQTMDEEMLKAICAHLKPITYTDGTYIIKKDEPLRLMFFVLAGYVVTESYPHAVVRVGEFCGQELLEWASTISFPAKLPTALESARANGDVRVLALTFDDWFSVGHKFSSSS
ncbi:putative rmlC-like jelly roll protein [Rosa chinensis]|uniref:Putative rmlC-like jelly roll protein n=1 Tax=Rosa chinensis TaxID=74649 RepID=A0A2P6SJU0_ROSCH|nr:putative rmlC-like jelly roll protein [Rosa chinensis]